MELVATPGGEPNDALGWAQGGALWAGIDHLLHTSGPLSSCLLVNQADDTKVFLRERCKILIVGAGGLGCELLKNIALSGFRQIHVIDLDTIDVTNLNRQFLFRAKDVGKSKALVAADFVNKRIPGANVIPHHANIMDFDSDFYSQFKIVIAGLDSIEARRWLNATLVELVHIDAEENVDQSTVIPLIDGGTEGFQGQARVIYPRLSSCFECTLSLFPQATNFPLCTIANTPRLPEHCIEYANVVLWNKLKPFGNVKLDADNVKHASWLFQTSKARAEQFGITGVTYRLTQGVAKNIIPAVASTNAIVAATCANEALKLATYMAVPMDNYMMYNGKFGVYTYTYKNQRRSDCPVCGAPVPRNITVKANCLVSEFLEMIAKDPDIRSKEPFLRSSMGTTIYAASPPALQKATSRNLGKKLTELVTSGTSLSLADKDLPFGRILIVDFE